LHFQQLATNPSTTVYFCPKWCIHGKTLGHNHEKPFLLPSLLGADRYIIEGTFRGLGWSDWSGRSEKFRSVTGTPSRASVGLFTAFRALLPAAVDAETLSSERCGSFTTPAQLSARVSCKIRASPAAIDVSTPKKMVDVSIPPCPRLTRARGWFSS
jgi:hypothetical protein